VPETLSKSIGQAVQGRDNLQLDDPVKVNGLPSNCCAKCLRNNTADCLGSHKLHYADSTKGRSLLMAVAPR